MSENERRPPRSYPLVAWAVICGVVGFILFRAATREKRDAAAWLVPMQAQGRMLVGLSNAGFPGSDGKLLYEQARETLHADEIDADVYSKRLRLAVLGGELVGPEKALAELNDLPALEAKMREKEFEVRPATVEAGRRLRKLYAGYEAGSVEPALGEDEQAALRAGLGWFGELALAPYGGDEAARSKALAPAYRAVFGYFSLMMGGCLSLGVGVILLATFTVLAALGRLRGWMRDDTGRGGLYAETFAIYMAMYVAVGFGFRALPESWNTLLLSGLAMLLGLLALAWPVVRGVPWREVRADVGLHAGKSPLAEILCGFGCYLCAVPVLLAGAIVMVLLSRGRPASSAPTHPVVGVALEAGWWVWVELFLVASVAAPLVEEIMFRGALYRHLREATSRWTRVGSVAVSALASAFVFAVIHPQGWLAVPVLGGLAVVFSVAREWRQSLVSPMVAHGVNNGVVTLMLLVTAS